MKSVKPSRYPKMPKTIEPPVLKPCPFCGRGLMFIERSADNSRCYIVCVHCGSSTGNYPNKEEAIKAWNTRRRPRT